MSAGWSMSDLHRMIRVGNGFRSWWFEEGTERAMIAAGETPSHYDGFVPVEEVRRLFGTIVPTIGEMHVTYTDNNGNRQAIKDTTRYPVVNATTGDVFYVAKNDAAWMSHNEVLTDNVLSWIGKDVGIGTAGLLRDGAFAFISVETPEHVTDNETGITILPRLNFTASLDGTSKGEGFDSYTVTVCQNTVAMARAESKNKAAWKRTKGLTLAKIRDGFTAAGLLAESAEMGVAGLHTLVAMPVTDPQWEAFISAHYGERPTDKGHAQTHWDNRFDALAGLYRNDARVSPWRGTGLGILQMTNTYETHIAIRRGAGDDESAKTALRAFRAYDDALTGRQAERDAATLATLGKVLTTV